MKATTAADVWVIAFGEVLRQLERRYARRLATYERTHNTGDWYRLDEARLALNAAIDVDSAARVEVRIMATRGGR